MLLRLSKSEKLRENYGTGSYFVSLKRSENKGGVKNKGGGKFEIGPDYEPSRERGGVWVFSNTS